MAATATIGVYLALGSNLGDRRANIAAALAQLAPDVRVEQVSSLYETEPAYVLDQPRFLNAVAHARTTLDPQALLARLKRVEAALGRAAGARFGPRVIDLDILLYAERVIATDTLSIPHPRMAERPFVLVPLAEIAPGLVPPGWASSVAVLAQSVRGQGDIIRRKGGVDNADSWD